MSIRLRHSFRLGKRTQVVYTTPLGGLLHVLGGVFALFLLGLGSLIHSVTPHKVDRYDMMPQPRHESSTTRGAENLTTAIGQEKEPQAYTSQTSGKSPVTPTPRPNSLQAVNARTLFESLHLGSRGFSFADHGTDTPPYWVFRRTDADREYTAVIVGSDSGTQAVTAELVGPDGSIWAQAKTYFASLAQGLLPAASKDAAETWIGEAIHTGGTNNFGDLTLSVAQFSPAHQKITFLPKP